MATEFKNMMLRRETRELIEAWSKLEGRKMAQVIDDMARTYKGRAEAYSEGAI